AARLRSAADLCRAALLAWRDKDFLEAAARPSRFSTPRIARDRFADTFLPRRRIADSALSLVRSVASSGGGGRSTPARRALDKPIAIACLVDSAPCLPSRMWCTSSRTNSPAWVLGDLPARLSA